MFLLMVGPGLLSSKRTRVSAWAALERRRRLRLWKRARAVMEILEGGRVLPRSRAAVEHLTRACIASDCLRCLEGADPIPPAVRPFGFHHPKLRHFALEARWRLRPGLSATMAAECSIR